MARLIYINTKVFSMLEGEFLLENCLLSSGVNRHFHMICIRDKFSQNIGRQVSSKVIWDHLSTMYDMQALVRDNPTIL